MTWNYVPITFGVLFLASLFVGYFVCHFVIGPIILSMNGIRRLRENYIWFGNLVLMEQDLTELAVKNVVSAKAVLKVITYCKWTGLVSFACFLVSFFLIATTKT